MEYFQLFTLGCRVASGCLLTAGCVLAATSARAALAQDARLLIPQRPAASSYQITPTQIAPTLPPIAVEPCVPDLRCSPNYDHWAKAPIAFWEHLLFPAGEIYAAPLADVKASRMAAVYNSDQRLGAVFDGVIGGRMPIWRYGTRQPVLPSGIQLDVEANAAFRMAIDRSRDMQATDYHFGIPLTFGNPHAQFKVAYEHVSSHLGDEYMLREAREGRPFRRINYVRDALVIGAAARLRADLRLYGEASYSFVCGEMTKPWLFEFGAEYTPVYAAAASRRGSPFLAIHVTLLEELDFSGRLVAEAGWQWRSTRNHLFRLGIFYLTGSDEQLEFFDTNINKVGFGLWYDF